MKKIQDLTTSDFPGIDPYKFENWKQAQLSITPAIKSANWFVWPALILLLLIRGIVGAMIFIAAFVGFILYMFLHVAPLSKRARELQKEAGIDPTDLRRALKG